jgi:1,4-alpha-glucan branching enzyme
MAVAARNVAEREQLPAKQRVERASIAGCSLLAASFQATKTIHNMIKKEHKKGDKQVKVTFALPQDEVGGKASVVGDFNNWDPKATRLVKRSNGTVSASVKLNPGGQYAFRYFFEDGSWANDSEADDHVASPFGTKNSVVLT